MRWRSGRRRPSKARSPRGASRRAAKQSPQAPAADAERAYRLAGARLRQRIWDPLADRLRGASPVFVVPDGALNLVSFAALPTGTSRYLLEDGPSSTTLSTERDLVPADSQSSGHGLLAVGGPAFDERMQATAPLSARRSGCATLGYANFEDLPGSRNEAADIAKIWPSVGSSTDNDVKLLNGRAATKTAVKQAAVGRRVVHLATHGYFLNRAATRRPATPAALALSRSHPLQRLRWPKTRCS